MAWEGCMAVMLGPTDCLGWHIPVGWLSLHQSTNIYQAASMRQALRTRQRRSLPFGWGRREVKRGLLWIEGARAGLSQGWEWDSRLWGGEQVFSTTLHRRPALSVLLHRGGGSPQSMRSSSQVLQPSAGKIEFQPHFLPLHPSHSLSPTPVSAGGETAEDHEVRLERETQGEC